jgi:hypothetical protein
MLEDEEAMPPPGGQRPRKADNADAGTAAAAAAAAAAGREEEHRRAHNEAVAAAVVAAEAESAAALAAGVTALFRHGGEESGTVPLRNVVFAKNLLMRNGFISAVEKLDTQSLDALLPTVTRVVEQVRLVQVENSFDMFDDLLRRLEALNASSAHAAAAAAGGATSSSQGNGGGSGDSSGDAAAGSAPCVAAPDDLVDLLAVGVLCARVCKGGYKSRRSLPTRVTHALIAAMVGGRPGIPSLSRL